jgi:hypothetical protein
MWLLMLSIIISVMASLKTTLATVSRILKTAFSELLMVSMHKILFRLSHRES